MEVWQSQSNSSDQVPIAAYILPLALEQRHSRQVCSQQLFLISHRLGQCIKCTCPNAMVDQEVELGARSPAENQGPVHRCDPVTPQALATTVFRLDPRLQLEKDPDPVKIAKQRYHMATIVRVLLAD